MQRNDTARVMKWNYTHPRHSRTPQSQLLCWYNGMELTLSFTDSTRSVSLTPSFMDSTRSVFHTIFHGLHKVCCCAGTMEWHSPCLSSTPWTLLLCQCSGSDTHPAHGPAEPSETHSISWYIMHVSNVCAAFSSCYLCLIWACSRAIFIRDCQGSHACFTNFFIQKQ